MIFKCHLPLTRLAFFKTPRCYWVPNGIYSQTEPNRAGKVNIHKDVMSIIFQYILILVKSWRESSAFLYTTYPIYPSVSILYFNGSLLTTFNTSDAWTQMNQYWYILISDQNNSDFISFSPNIRFSVLNITLNLIFISSQPPLNSDNFSDFLFLMTLRVLKGNDQNVPQVELASCFLFCVVLFLFLFSPWLYQVVGAVEIGGLIFCFVLFFFIQLISEGRPQK